MFKGGTLLIFKLLLILKLSSGDKEVSVYKKSISDDQFPSEISIPLLQEEWSKGNIDAGGELAFGRVLGMGIEHDLSKAILDLDSLISMGAFRAHTTFALLLNHNLTDTLYSKEERKAKAQVNYLTAAVKGDPLAQMIVGENYFHSGDCESAVNYYYKASSFAIKNILEMEVSRPSFVKHIWEDDGELPIEAFPSQEQMDFLEYVAEGGDGDAALRAASLVLSHPTLNKKDFNKAQDFLKIAVKGNNSIAMVWLGQMYLRNLMEGSDNEALDLLEKALEYGNDLAHSGLGRIFMEGRAGHERDFKKAEYHFKKGIEAGNIDSFYHLGRLYNLKEAPGTPEEAAEVWTIPASLGHVHSAWALAEYYREHYLKSTYRTVLSPDSTEISTRVCDIVVTLYRIVSQAGEWISLFDDAFDDYISGKKEAALMKYFLLSDLGYGSAHINAARILDEGSTDLYPNEESYLDRAFEMWQRSSRAGTAKGHVRVGDYYYYGIGNVTKDFKMAYNYYNKASVMEDGEGRFSVAYLTEWGEGVPQNITKAKLMYSDLMENNTEAGVPASLTLMRLVVFESINELLNVNLYKFDWTFDRTLVRIPNVDFLFKWDIILISLLLIIIFVCLKLR